MRRERDRKDERGEEERGWQKQGELLRASAHLSVWKGRPPVLNIAARLGRW